VSLDESDNDFRIFLSYMLAGVQTIFPGVGGETQAMLNAPELPSVPLLARTLINELDQIEEEFILVLDDYHFIREQAVHDLLVELTTYPPRSMHLVMATRRDPSWPLASHRAGGNMTEIRMQELRFSVPETASFLQKVMGMEVDDKMTAILAEKTEGWVVGLRLAALSLRHQPNLDSAVSGLPDNNHYVMDYLVTEVLSIQPPAIQDYLLSTAILKRFCAPLCEAVCIVEAEPEACPISGEEFINQLEQANLFVIPLDDQRRWYRYHHLFQKLLQRQMEKRFRPDAIAGFHQKASAWFIQNSLIDEALHHLLAAGDVSAAQQLVIQNRHHLTELEQWHRLEYWIGLLPKESVDNHPELLIAKAWLCENRFRIPEMVDLLERAETLLAEKGLDTFRNNWLDGEVAALKAGRLYVEGNGKRAISYAKQALEKIPQHHASERAFTLLVLAFAYQMTGKLKAAQAVVLNALEQADAYTHTYQARLLFALCFIDWTEADLHGLQQTATQVLDFGQKHGLLESTSFANYFLGIAHESVILR
jgi:LuxR family maltose regulon positive regulatory protein